MLLLHNLARARLTRFSVSVIHRLTYSLRFFPSGFLSSSSSSLPQLPLSLSLSLPHTLSHSSSFHPVNPFFSFFLLILILISIPPLDLILIDFPIRVFLSPHANSTTTTEYLHHDHYLSHAFSLTLFTVLTRLATSFSYLRFFPSFLPNCAPFRPYCFVSALRLASNILV